MRFILPLIFFSNFLFGQNLTPKKYENLHTRGYEDGQGNNIIAPEYFEAQPFEGDFAIVKKTKGYGVINKKGESIFDCKYGKIKHWQNGIFLMYWKNSNAIHVGIANDKKTLNPRYDRVTFFYKNELRAYSTFGTTIVFPDGEVEHSKGIKDIIWRQDYG